MFKYSHIFVHFIFKSGDRHMKVTILDPNANLAQEGQQLSDIKVLRAKLLVICTSSPGSLIASLIIKAYWRAGCLNVVIIYQEDDGVRAWGFNPFGAKSKFMKRLDPTKDLFPDKTTNLYGYTLVALFITQDRTKAIRKTNRERRNYYMGKDYEIVNTIFSHINATVQILKVPHYLNLGEINPWISSNFHSVNRSLIRRRIMSESNVTLLLQSQPFCKNDGVVENTYPHTQDDDCIIVKKSTEIPYYHEMMKLFTLFGWIGWLAGPIGKYSLMLR